MRKIVSPSAEQMAQCVVRLRDLKGNPASALAGPGVEECAVIGTRASGDGFARGPIAGWWAHGFTLRCLKMRTGAVVALHSRWEAEVVFVHTGTLEITTPSGVVMMGAGDTFTTPIGMPRGFRATSSDGCTAFITRGGDAPGPVVFSQPKAA